MWLKIKFTSSQHQRRFKRTKRMKLVGDCFWSILKEVSQPSSFTSSSPVMRKHKLQAINKLVDVKTGQVKIINLRSLTFLFGVSWIIINYRHQYLRRSHFCRGNKGAVHGLLQLLQQWKIGLIAVQRVVLFMRSGMNRSHCRIAN